jgi:CBS domain-containing protein
MWQGNCGVIPVTDDHGTIAGILTDRDICTFVAARDYPPRQMLAGAVATKMVFTCGPDDDVSEALSLMRQHHVRRLPVVDGSRVLLGMLSLTDIARAARGEPGVAAEAFVDTFCSVYQRERPTAVGRT